MVIQYFPFASMKIIVDRDLRMELGTPSLRIFQIDIIVGLISYFVSCGQDEKVLYIKHDHWKLQESPRTVILGQS